MRRNRRELSTLTLAAIAAALALATIVACSSDASDDGGTGGTNAGTGGTGASDASSGGSGTQGCVQPGDHGNEFGIGEYCTPNGQECAQFPQAPLCLADAAPSDDQWFCTRIMCSDDTVCGTDAHCLITDRGSACVPNRCVDPNG